MDIVLQFLVIILYNFLSCSCFCNSKSYFSAGTSLFKVIDVVLVSLLLTFKKISHIVLQFSLLIWTNKCRLVCFKERLWLFYTPCLSVPAESSPESSPVKMRPAKSILGEKSLDFPSLQCRSYNSVNPSEYFKSLILPSGFLNFNPMSFDVTPVILLRQSLVPGMVCRFYSKLLLNL